MATIADRIKERRKAIGLNQEQLAEMLHITQSQVSRYERGENEPTSDALISLSHMLNTSADFLLGITDDPAVSRSDLSEVEQQLLAAWRREDKMEAMRIIMNG